MHVYYIRPTRRKCLTCCVSHNMWILSQCPHFDLIFARSNGRTHPFSAIGSSTIIPLLNIPRIRVIGAFSMGSQFCWLFEFMITEIQLERAGLTRPLYVFHWYFESAVTRLTSPMQAVSHVAFWARDYYCPCISWYKREASWSSEELDRWADPKVHRSIAARRSFRENRVP